MGLYYKHYDMTTNQKVVGSNPAGLTSPER